MNLPIAIGLAVFAHIVFTYGLLPSLNRLPALIGWDDEPVGRSAAIRNSQLWRHAFSAILTLGPVLVFYHYGTTRDGFVIATMLLMVGAITWTDIIEHLVPEAISIPLLLLGLTLSPYTDFPSGVFGAVFGFGLMYVGMLAFSWLRGIDVIAGGDIMLCATGGAWFGFERVFHFSFIAFGLFIVMALINQALTKEEEFPMGPGFAGAFGLMAYLLSQGQIFF